jgi:hypothetical protein
MYGFLNSVTGTLGMDAGTMSSPGLGDCSVMRITVAIVDFADLRGLSIVPGQVTADRRARSRLHTKPFLF